MEARARGRRSKLAQPSPDDIALANVQASFRQWEADMDALEASKPLEAASLVATSAVHHVRELHDQAARLLEYGTVAAADRWTALYATRLGRLCDRMQRLLDRTDCDAAFASVNDHAVEAGGRFGMSYFAVAFYHANAAKGEVYRSCNKPEWVLVDVPFPDELEIIDNLQRLCELLTESNAERLDYDRLYTELQKEFQRVEAARSLNVEPFVPAPQDLDILTALSKTPSSMAIVDLAADAGCDRKLAGERIGYLKAARFVAHPGGKKYLIGITEEGRDYLLKRPK